MRTLFVNLYGAPGAGKSTTMAALFAELKWRNIDSEMLSEFAKDLVWERCDETFKDQTYIFAKQHHKFARVNGKVRVAICDSPLLLSIVYNRVGGNESISFNKTVLEHMERYTNLDIFLNRTKEYNSNGRHQTEEESDNLSYNIKDTLREFNIPFQEVDATRDNVKMIADMIEIKLRGMRPSEYEKAQPAKTGIMYYGRCVVQAINYTLASTSVQMYSIGRPFLIGEHRTYYDLQEFKELVQTSAISTESGRIAHIYINGYETNLSLGDFKNNATAGSSPVIPLESSDRYLQGLSVTIDWESNY